MHCLQGTARLFLALWMALAPVKAWAASCCLLGVFGGAASSTPPSITFAGGSTSGASTQSQTSGSISIPASVADQFVLVGITVSGPVTLPASITISPSAGGSITANLVVKWDAASGSTNNPMAGIYAGTVTAGSTSMTASVTFGANPFNVARWSVGTIPAANLLSTTATGSGVLHATTATTATTSTFSASANGALFIVAGSSNIASNSGSLSATDTPTLDTNLSVGSVQVASGHANGITASASYSATATYTQSGNVSIVAAAWR